MIKEFVERWELNKHKLEKHLTENEISTYDSYKELFELLLNLVINDENDYSKFGNIVELNDGDYQGTYIFIANKETYQPDANDYITSYVSYGSCSGCDTLLNITGYSSKLPNKNQVDDLMTLCLHMLQRCKYIGGSDEN